MIELRFTPPETRPKLRPGPRFYRIAERRIRAAGEFRELQAFVAGKRWHPCLPASGNGPRRAHRQLLFRGEAELGGSLRAVECYWRSDGYHLMVTGLGRFGISPAGDEIAFDRGCETTEAGGVVETIVGPILILSLALQGVWCLHASAIQLGDRALVFMGPSGAGKSTLARELPELLPDGRCAADDVLPLDLATEEVRALPHFPQLKYRSDRQPGAGVSASLPIEAIYLIDSRPAAAEVASQRLTGVSAVLALVSHTHSTRLYTKELLRRHTGACVQLANRVPIRRLVYPHRDNVLPKVAELLRHEHES